MAGVPATPKLRGPLYRYSEQQIWALTAILRRIEKLGLDQTVRWLLPLRHPNGDRDPAALQDRLVTLAKNSAGPCRTDPSNTMSSTSKTRLSRPPRTRAKTDESTNQ
ncbi:hypothetical protein ACFFX0_01420 [Citricoccus parietis]|uniref:HTH merR-type domain-containing protein n=1 Tax=Citricoccus parietis TaxID=592307 RepID=A0ABV5FTE5_9MICC